MTGSLKGDWATEVNRGADLTLVGGAFSLHDLLLGVESLGSLSWSAWSHFTLELIDIR